MITEKIVAKSFHSLWEEALPLLTPNFVRLFNVASSEDLTELPSSSFKHIPIGVNVTKHDVVAELSFQLAKTSLEYAVSLDEIKKQPQYFEQAFARTISFITTYEDEDLNQILNADEIAEAFFLAKQYENLFAYLGAAVVEFSPRIHGSGFLGSCEADLSIDDTLYEIKTVTRNIAGRDIKQLIIYLALQYSAGNRRWTHAGFFNPRKSLHYKFSVDHLIYRTSGGRSTPEVFKDIVDYLINRGVEIDSIF